MFRGPPRGSGGLEESAGREAKWGHLSGAHGTVPTRHSTHTLHMEVPCLRCPQTCGGLDPCAGSSVACDALHLF